MKLALVRALAPATVLVATLACQTSAPLSTGSTAPTGSRVPLASPRVSAASPATPSAPSSAAPCDGPLPPDPTAEEGEPLPAEQPYWDRGVIFQLSKYGAAHPDDFGAFWFDPNTSALFVGFTKTVPQHAAAIARLVSDPVHVVEVGATETQLRDLLDRVTGDEATRTAAGFRFYTGSTDRHHFGVHLTGSACHRDVAIEAYRARYGDAVRLTVYEKPGPEPAQPKSGEGWRLLAELPETGNDFGVAYADDAAAYRALINRVGLASAPAVALDRELVAAFVTSGGPKNGGECSWVTFVSVTFDRQHGAAIGTIDHPLPPGVGCDTMFVPHTFLVAIERSRLPQRPFFLRMSDAGCEPCTREVVVR